MEGWWVDGKWGGWTLAVEVCHNKGDEWHHLGGSTAGVRFHCCDHLNNASVMHEMEQLTICMVLGCRFFACMYHSSRLHLMHHSTFPPLCPHSPSGVLFWPIFFLALIPSGRSVRDLLLAFPTLFLGARRRGYNRHHIHIPLTPTPTMATMAALPRLMRSVHTSAVRLDAAAATLAIPTTLTAAQAANAAGLPVTRAMAAAASPAPVTFTPKGRPVIVRPPRTTRVNLPSGFPEPLAYPPSKEYLDEVRRIMDDLPPEQAHPPRHPLWSFFHVPARSAAPLREGDTMQDMGSVERLGDEGTSKSGELREGGQEGKEVIWGGGSSWPREATRRLEQEPTRCAGR